MEYNRLQEMWGFLGGYFFFGGGGSLGGSFCILFSFSLFGGEFIFRLFLLLVCRFFNFWFFFSSLFYGGGYMYLNMYHCFNKS